jgi:hypothetical protein
MNDLSIDQIAEIYDSEWNTAIFNLKQCAPSVLESLFPLLLRLFALTFLQSILFRISNLNF